MLGGGCAQVCLIDRKCLSSIDQLGIHWSSQKQLNFEGQLGVAACALLTKTWSVIAPEEI
jgi:hypothetical protein